MSEPIKTGDRATITAGAVPDEQLIAEYGIKASRMMARDLTRFDAACEVDKYLREQGAPGYYRHRMSIILYGNVEGTEASRAPENSEPSTTAQAADSQPVMTPETVYAAIAHGDQDHRAWLLSALRAVWCGEAVPPVASSIADAPANSQPAHQRDTGYPPLPECDATTVGLGAVWNRHSMRAYVDADRAARAPADSVTAAVVIECGNLYAKVKLTDEAFGTTKVGDKLYRTQAAESVTAPAGGGAVVEWHAPGLGEVHNESHGQLIFCTDGDDVADDTLARRVCAALNATPPAQAADSVPAPVPPPECETEAEKRAFAFGWFKALESERMKADNKKKDPL